MEESSHSQCAQEREEALPFQSDGSWGRGQLAHKPTIPPRAIESRPDLLFERLPLPFKPPLTDTQRSGASTKPSSDP